MESCCGCPDLDYVAHLCISLRFEVEVHAVLLGMQAPRVPVLAEDLEMKKLINTYGKTFHTWQVDRGDTLPLGTPLPLHFLPMHL
jgi:hypothetical protein